MTQTSSLATTTGGILAPGGFRAAAVHAGVKAQGLDLALLVADTTATAAAVFTTNKAVAAPVVVSREHLAHSGGRAQAIGVNSGCANACTGAVGLRDAQTMVRATAEAAGCAPEHALIASTGVIGEPLPIDRITRGLATAAGQLGREGHTAAAEAIMTTDRGPKEAAVRVTTPAGTFTVGGMAKGAGMIEPRMATMLAFLTTDAEVEPARLQRALQEAVAVTFNAITVDGEPSTNDSVFVLASGTSGVRIEEALHDRLVAGLCEVARPLARAIVQGGEGATKLVTARVTGAATEADAWRAARAIANSPLVKTAVNGGDPNWGRLVAVAGRADVAFEPGRCRVRIGPAVLFEDDTIHAEREPEAAAHLAGDEVVLEVDLGTGGSAEATVWTCDFSADYVRINADYRT